MHRYVDIQRTVLFLVAAIAAFCGSPRASAEDSAPRGAAWLVYWDMQKGADDLARIGKRLASVQLFAATFDADDAPVIHEDLRAFLAESGSSLAGHNLYLTIVNDAETREGKTILKDPDLITRLVSTPERRSKHRRELLNLMEVGGFAGLDIDYEKVKQDDWPAFLQFAAELSSDLSSRGKRLRVVLEPSPAYYKQPLPPGPEYVVMAYNLFGGHSGPGPKANPSFLARLAKQARDAGMPLRLALSTGGFIWPNEGKVASVTEQAALALAAKHNASLVRDPDSRYLRFTYKEDDVDHTVWYADAVAMEHLIETGKRLGFETFDIWRLGGLSPETLDAIARASFPSGAAGAGGKPRTLRVGQGRAHRTISSALAAAAPGDAIEIDPGRYRESIRVTTPNLTIGCPRGLEPSRPVTVVGAGKEPALYDAANTRWRGVTFVGEGDNAVSLDAFGGGFEHCAFEVRDGIAVAAYDGNPRFNACSFKGNGGTGVLFTSYSVDVSQPAGLADFVYCLFEGFRAEAVHLADSASARLANCLVARSGAVIRRSGTADGTAAVVNSIIYNSNSGTLVNAGVRGEPVTFDHCIIPPTLNRRFWVNGPPLSEQPHVVARDCVVASPRFVRSGRRLLLNFGIDDTVNIGVFDEVSADAERYGIPMTIAVNTAAVDKTGWEKLREFLRRGHEVASHSLSHSSVEMGIPMAIGYSGAGENGGRASLTIEQGKAVVATVDGREAARVPLDGPEVNLLELGRRLHRAGFVTSTSPLNANISASLLAGVEDLDVTFPVPAVPLYLESERFFGQQIDQSFRDIRANLPELSETPFVNPFTVTSPLVRRRIAEAGFSSARALVPLAVGDEEIDGGAVSEDVLFNPFVIPCRSLGDTPCTREDDPAVQSFLVMLDVAKDMFPGFSFYAHTFDEISMEQWEEIFRLVSEDPNVQPVTLNRLAREVRMNGKELGDDDYQVNLRPFVDDFRLRMDSPGVRKGVPVGAAFDFAGNPVDPSVPPNIGIYQ